MIAKLKGILDSTGDNWVIIDVQGVGYQAMCSQKTLANLPNKGEALTLYIETVVRQDMIQLYGFAEQSEKDWFNLLTTVQGVGMRVGLAILSVLQPAEIEQALAAQDKSMIARADGVGPKLAARITNELKDKRPVGYTTASLQILTSAVSSGQAEAISALVNLGYRRQDAAEALASVCNDPNAVTNVEDMIRQGLNKLART